MHVHASGSEPAARAAAERHRRMRWLVAIDITVGVLVLAGWLSIPLLRTHIVLGSALVLVVAAHLGTRPKLVAGLARGWNRSARRRSVRRRLAADVVLALATVAATVTGFVQWAGVAPGLINGLHSMTSGVLMIFAVRHVWVRRRTLRSRLARPVAAGSTTSPDGGPPPGS